METIYDRYDYRDHIKVLRENTNVQFELYNSGGWCMVLRAVVTDNAGHWWEIYLGSHEDSLMPRRDYNEEYYGWSGGAVPLTETGDWVNDHNEPVAEGAHLSEHGDGFRDIVATVEDILRQLDGQGRAVRNADGYKF